MIIIAASIALIAGAAGLLWLGFTPTMPQDLDTTRSELTTAQVQYGELVLQADRMATQIAEQERRNSSARETLDDLNSQMASLNAVRTQLEENIAENATVIAEARDSRAAVESFATAEAQRAALLDELQRRSERVERFVQRLSDISSDTALDLQGSVTPTPLALPTLTSQPTASATPVATPTATLSPTVTLAPTATAVRSSPTITATVRATP
jgi:signal transduction histidine kinase